MVEWNIQQSYKGTKNLLKKMRKGNIVAIGTPNKPTPTTTPLKFNVEGKAIVTPKYDKERYSNNAHLTNEVYRLLKEYGFMYHHARTSENIISCAKSTKAELRTMQKTQPCIAHNQRKNTPHSRRFKNKWQLKRFVIKPQEIGVQVNGKPTKQFETVWYSNGQRRK